MTARVAIHDADRTSMPNLAAMKLAAWHRACGDEVCKFMPLMPCDITYSCSVFSRTERDPYLPADAILGGTGYGLMNTLPDDIEHMCPDYAFAGVDYSMGFLTRGCPNSCAWCIVPRKEGQIRPHADILEFTRHQTVKLLDNNFLALPEYAVKQLDAIRRNDLRVDFNQGLDARLLDATLARHLGSVRWSRFIRLACDHWLDMQAVDKALRLLRTAGGHYREYFCYVLVREDVDDANERVQFLDGLNVSPFAQPYLDWDGTEPTYKQKVFANWCNRPPLRKTTPWPQYWEQVKARKVSA